MRKHTCDSLRLRLHKPHVAILTAARFTFAVFCSGQPLHTDCCSFYLPRRAEIVSQDCLLRGLNPDLLREHAWERPTTYPTELARYRLIYPLVCNVIPTYVFTVGLCNYWLLRSLTRKWKWRPLPKLIYTIFNSLQFTRRAIFAAVDSCCSLFVHLIAKIFQQIYHCFWGQATQREILPDARVCHKLQNRQIHSEYN